MDKIKRGFAYIWERKRLRLGLLLVLFITSALSYPILFRLLFREGGFTFLFRYDLGFYLAALILIHEWFHLRAMREYGIEGLGPIPLPFMGALVEEKTPFPTLWAKFAVVLRGPLSGALALPLLAAATALGPSDLGLLLGAVAGLWLVINITNLLPVFPLDGGLAVAAILGSIHVRLADLFVVLSLLLSLVLGIFWEPILFLVPLVTVLEMLLGRMRRKKKGPVPPVRMSPRQVAIATASYLGALGSLLLTFYVASRWGDVVVLFKALF